MVWFLGFPRDLLAVRLKQSAMESVENKMTGWAQQVMVKAFNLEKEEKVTQAKEAQKK